jgi:hypothetical protein
MPHLQLNETAILIQMALEKLKQDTNKIWQKIQKAPDYGKSEHFPEP